MRDVTLRFANRIDRQISAAVAAGKGENGWHEVDAGNLLMSVDQHVDALRNELICGAGKNDRATDEEYRKQVAHEAADAAAYLMMLADNAELGRVLYPG